MFLVSGIGVPVFCGCSTSPTLPPAFFAHVGTHATWRAGHTHRLDQVLGQVLEPLRNYFKPRFALARVSDIMDGARGGGGDPSVLDANYPLN